MNVVASSVRSHRIALRPFRPDDAADFFALNKNADVRRFIGGEPLTMEFCREHMKRCADKWETIGYSQCAIVLRESERLIGRGGINMLDELGELEVSWVIARDE